MLLQQRLLGMCQPQGLLPQLGPEHSLGGRYRWSPAPLVEKLRRSQ